MSAAAARRRKQLLARKKADNQDVLTAQLQKVLFEPGDRCAVLMTNDSATTERMLQALAARGLVTNPTQSGAHIHE